MRTRRARFSIALAILAMPVVLGVLLVATPAIRWIGFGGQVEVGNYNDYRISGSVVAEDGAPIDGITIDVQKARRRKMGFETDYENSYVKIGKSFDIHADNCNSVDLHFLHNDYEMKTLTFTQGGTYRNVRVVLKRKGP